jgi:hypothetical protein
MAARRALLIGIDGYQKIKPLEGCVNDVDVMESILLQNFAFPRENIRVLRNAEATRDAILAAFDAFVASVGPEDQVVLHYAGHGSQMTDREGDEPSGLDSTIMPVDSEGWQGDNRDITDDEIHLRLLEPIGAKTSFTTFIFDCCHSGTITRDDFGASSRSMPPDRRPVAELPPSPIPEAKRTGARESGPSGWMPLADKYVLISGCRDEELSYEYAPPEGNGKLKHGALTYFLSRELRQATPGTTYRDIFERAAGLVTAANDRQHPQMEGRADREIFGIRDLEPTRFVLVGERKGAKVTLAAGAALGLTPGSTYAVYPQGTKNAEAGEPLGEIEITAVRGITSDARITSEKAKDAVIAGCRAFETVHAFGELRLRVQVAGPSGLETEVAALRAAIEKSPLLALAADDDAAAARVYLIPPRQAAGKGDPVPQLGAVAAPVWAGVKEDGQLMMPPKPAGAVADVVRNLETLARYRQALALDNPDPSSGLRGAFELLLLRQAADGTWSVAKPDLESGQIIYEEGEKIAFRVISHQKPGTEPPYVSLLDFGVSGSVSLIFPAPGAKEKMLPDGYFEVGTQGDEFELSLPDAFPFAADPAAGGVTAGTETVKLIVTSGEADFGFLEQQGMRSAQGAPAAAQSPLMMLFETATRGSATREIRKKPVRQEDWTTVVKPFVLRRRQTGSLNADGRALALGGATLATPGLEGEVRTHAWGSDRAEAAEQPPPELTRALAESGIDVRQTIEISAARAAGPATRSAGGAPPVMELSLRDPGADHGQMVMASDELGVVSWHFASGPEAVPAGSRGAAPAAAGRRYLIPQPVPSAAPAGPGQRGLLGAAGRKFIKEMVFPLVDPALGAIGEAFAGRWEAKHRPYRIRGFTPDDFVSPDAAVIDSEGWRRLGEGRALLLVHGTFSRAHTAFGDLPKDFVESLHARYGGRVFAFDHYTLSHDPRQNVSWFFERLPSGSALDLDIICHSRGGLVARLLSEKLGELNVGSSSLKVARIVFVGSPNAGTVLANPDRIGDLIDTWTNLLNFIPAPGVGDVLAGIVTVAKQLAVGAAGGLKGLQSMKPGGDFATWLNTGGRAGDARYYALASDFTPAEPGLREFAKNRLMDMVFKGPNDLVVPTDGVFAENGSGFFPIEDRLVFTGADAVAHTAFFGKRAARDRIMEWLSA